MESLHDYILKSIRHINKEVGYPTFTWLVDNNQYTCIASIAEFKRDLVEGGFKVEKLLTMTDPLYDKNGNYTFPNNVLPTSQQLLSYQGLNYRIESVKQDGVFDQAMGKQTSTSGARIRIVAVSTTRGI